MDIVLVIIGLILCIIGIVGSVFPVLPGPPFGWLGLLLLELTNAIPNNYWFLGVTFIIAIGIFLLDYWMPSISTKKFGGSKAGAIGAVLGLIIGLLSPIPFGFLTGPFAGAFIGDIIVVVAIVDVGVNSAHVKASALVNTLKLFKIKPLFNGSELP